MPLLEKNPRNTAFISILLKIFSDLTGKGNTNVVDTSDKIYGKEI